MITEITPAQEALIRVYREKWRAIALSTEPINRPQAAEAVKALYELCGRKEPQIFFCDSPFARIQIILNFKQRPERLGYAIGREMEKLSNSFLPSLQKMIDRHVAEKIRKQLYRYRNSLIVEKLENQIVIQIMHYLSVFCPELDNFISLQNWSENRGNIMDFCISVMHCEHDQKAWQVLKMLSSSCNVIYPFEKIAIISDRPKKIAMDSQNRLHAESAAAVQFRDGYSFYSYHGVTVPESYSQAPPDRWEEDWYIKELDFELKNKLIQVLPTELVRSHWLLKERNSELRRSLISRLGYKRLYQELQAEKLDSWQDYELLKIKAKIDEEPINLLKMTCPSTGEVHAMRVPPNMTSAREAISWVNWDIDPEQFSVQT
ncbi:MAG: DUF6745 domain-containing protein [Hormoscilla sp.]